MSTKSLHHVSELCRHLTQSTLNYEYKLTLTLQAEQSRTKPNRTDCAWKTNLRYEMKALTVIAGLRLTELSVFENMVLRIIFGPRRDEVKGGMEEIA